MRGRGLSSGGGAGRGRGSGYPIVSGARHTATAPPVSVLTRKNDASSSRVGAEEGDADPMYANVREPVLLAPIVTEFEFPSHIKTLLNTNGVRHLLSDCVEYHDSHGLQQGRQVAPMVNWSRMARDMRISVTLFAAADVEYFHDDLMQLDNVQAVLAGSKPLWSAHLTLSGHIQQLHSFLLQSVALFVVDTLVVDTPPAPPAQPPAKRQQLAPAPPAAVGAAEMEDYQHQHHPITLPQPRSSASPPTSTTTSTVASVPSLVWVDMGEGQPHNESCTSFILSKAGFKVQKQERMTEHLQGGYDDTPTACIFFKYRFVPDYRIIGQYVANGGIFIHVGERFPIVDEKQAFPNLQWKGKQDCYVGNAKLTAAGSQYFTGTEGTSWRTKRFWSRNVPISESLAIAVDEQGNQTYPARSCMAIHKHGKGLYVYVGDCVLDGRPINMIRDIILKHIKTKSKKGGGLHADPSPAAAASSSSAQPYPSIPYPTTLCPPVAPPQPQSGGAGKTAWIDMGDMDGDGLANKLTSVGFACKNATWGGPGIGGLSGPRAPSAFVYYSIAEKINFKIVGDYVHRGGVFVYIGDRCQSSEERKAFPSLLWSDQKDYHRGHSKVTPMMGPEVLGKEYEEASWYCKRVWARNVPGCEAIMNGMDETTGRLAVPNVCSMAIHRHGKGVYFFVGDINLEGHSVDMIRKVILKYSKAPSSLSPPPHPQQQQGGKGGQGAESDSEDSEWEDDDDEDDDDYEDFDSGNDGDDYEMYMRHAQQGDPIDPMAAYGLAMLQGGGEGAEMAMVHACAAMGMTPSEYWRDD